MENLRKLLRWTEGLSYPLRIFYATLVVAAVTLIRWLLKDYMNGHFYTLFLVAVTICAVVLDRKMGIYALVLSCLAAFIDRRFGLFVEPAERVSLLVFIISSFVLIAVGEFFRGLADALNDADDAKTTLLRELRHRTRNYQQIVIAAVRVAAANATHDETKGRLASVAQQIESIGRIGEALETRDKKGFFDARQYFERLVSVIAASLVGARPLAVDCRAEAVPIEHETAELLGIVVNELITNAMKYAFPDNRTGSVTVEFARRPGGGMRLTVSDNGIGRSAHAAKGTGLGLVSALVKMRGGTVDIQDANPGCRVVVRLPAAMCD